MHAITSGGLDSAAQLPETLSSTGSFSGVVQLALEHLQHSGSPRADHTNSGYARLLADSAERFPPIVVHRESMSVIDGHHRVEATRMRGATTISAVLYEGDAKSAFVLAVRLNVTHGLPLTIAERKAAALRLLTDNPGWSDRAVAAVSGISDKTVAAIRRSNGQRRPEILIGRDGSVHRTLNVQGRRRAAQLLAADPDASLREVAAVAGISLTTAKDVRSRVRRGEDPVPAGRRRPNTVSGKAIAPIGGRTGSQDPDSAMRRLQLDPSVRYTELGRNLLRCLTLSKVDENTIQDIVTTLPGHCRALVIEVARQRSNEWRRLARELAESTAPAASAITVPPGEPSPITTLVVRQHDRSPSRDPRLHPEE